MRAVLLALWLHRGGCRTLRTVPLVPGGCCTDAAVTQLPQLPSGPAATASQLLPAGPLACLHSVAFTWLLPAWLPQADNVWDNIEDRMEERRKVGVRCCCCGGCILALGGLGCDHGMRRLPPSHGFVPLCCFVV